VVPVVDERTQDARAMRSTSRVSVLVTAVVAELGTSTVVSRGPDNEGQRRAPAVRIGDCSAFNGQLCGQWLGARVSGRRLTSWSVSGRMAVVKVGDGLGLECLEGGFEAGPDVRSQPLLRFVRLKADDHLTVRRRATPDPDIAVRTKPAIRATAADDRSRLDGGTRRLRIRRQSQQRGNRGHRSRQANQHLVPFRAIDREVETVP